MSGSIISQLLSELTTDGNYGVSEARTRDLVLRIETLLNKRVLFYFASEEGVDQSSMINDQDAFAIENILSMTHSKEDLVLVLHSNGGFAISAERIIDVCVSYCRRNGLNHKFSVIVPKRAKSAATILALGADRVYLRETAELGPVDPQIPITDATGRSSYVPAYLQIDSIENLIRSGAPLSFARLKTFFTGQGKLLSEVPDQIKIKFLEQCNYALYVHSKNELGLSDSIVAKIAKEKIVLDSTIKETDFDIFRDPHLTKSHGRLIGLKDLQNNNLCASGVIASTNNLCRPEQRDSLEEMLWELYVRKIRLLNDPGNGIVKTIEGSDEFFGITGKKNGQV